MPAKSKKQQRFFAVVDAYLKGKIKNPSASVVRAAETMSGEDIRHFASTKHEGLPEKVASYIGSFLKEKRAWSKTPVVIQNKNAVYEFDSIEEACQYLSSIGTLSYDEIDGMLRDRAGLINGFQITYPTDKAAEVVDIDPSHRQNATRRARRIVEALTRPDNDRSSEELIEEHEKKHKKHMDKVIDDVDYLVSNSDKAIKTISNLLGKAYDA